MPNQRPVSMLVLAIFQILFGLFSICGGVMILAGVQQALAAAQQSGPNKPPISQQQLEEYIEKEKPGYAAIVKIQGGFSLTLGVLMILGAIGLLMVQGWGWWTTLVYAIGSLLNHAFGLIYTFAVVIPTITKYTQEVVPKMNLDNQAEAMAIGMMIGAYGAAIGAGLVVIYPIIVLILLMLPGVRRAYLGSSEPKEPEESQSGWAEN